MTESLVQAIRRELTRAIHVSSLTANDLEFHPELLDLLVPPTGETKDVDKGDRALVAEELILAAIASVAERDNMAAEALLRLLGLKHDPTLKYTPSFGRTLHKRQLEASAFLDVSVQTFSRNRECKLISALAFEIRRIQRGGHEHPYAV